MTPVLGAPAPAWPPVAGLPALARCRVMGVVNVTPDSFSDGGLHATTGAAVAHGLALRAEGADLVDVGGESTRPGAARVAPEEELARVLPVVRELAAAGVPVSVDTTRASVADAAVGAGAVLVNDVTGGRHDPDLLRVVAASGVACVLMHSRGDSRDMQQLTSYDGGVVAGVTRELEQRLAAAAAAGVRAEQVVVDPGLGFAKTAAQNWELLRALPALGVGGRPVLVGASRKSFLGALLAEQGQPRPVDRRDDATQALTALAAAVGCWAVRVHDVRRAADAVLAAAAWTGSLPTAVTAREPA